MMKDIKYSTSDMVTALSSPEARRVLRRIVAQSNVLGVSYAQNDAYGTAFNEGLRTVGLWLKTEIDKADPEAFFRMLSEK